MVRERGGMEENFISGKYAGIGTELRIRDRKEAREASFPRLVTVRVHSTFNAKPRPKHRGFLFSNDRIDCFAEKRNGGLSRGEQQFAPGRNIH